MMAAQDFTLVTTTAKSVPLMAVQSSDLILNFSSFSLMRDLNKKTPGIVKGMERFSGFAGFGFSSSVRHICVRV